MKKHIASTRVEENGIRVPIDVAAKLEFVAYFNKYVKDEDYRESKTKEPSLIKILKGAANNDYDYDYRRKQRANPNRIKLLLEDGSFWRNKDSIPQEVWKKCLKQ